MSFFKKLFGSKEKVTSETAPSGKIVRVCCPLCNSSKVALQFHNKDADTNEAAQNSQSRRCICIESGSVKKVCQDCDHIWDNEELNSPALIMPKHGD